MGSEERSDISNTLTRIENSPLKTVIETLVNKTVKGEKDLDLVKKETDQFFLIVVAMLIFFMQCGFAFLEAGSVRSKNTVNILIKNMLDVFIGGISYWALGWGLAYGAGGNPFCGGSQFFNYQLPYDQYPTWFFQFVFAATAATIVSGAVAERCQFMAYFLYSVIITGWVYPPVSHWAWDSSGWLAATGYYMDFAGSGVVHLLGACCSLVGCCLLGARTGRFSEEDKVKTIEGHSVPLAGLGGFILIFGFLAFNGGSQGSISGAGDGSVVALAIVNTILGASTGGLAVLFINKFLFSQPWSFLMTLNGALAGMVALCAGCDKYEPWAALLVGSWGGMGFIAMHHLMIKIKLDDPLDAVAVHGAGGVVGLLSVPWLMFSGLEEGQRGVFWDGDSAHPWLVLGHQVIGILAISAWSVFWSFLVFGALKVLNILRVPQEDEEIGMDITKHGEAAYPVSAWQEYQYRIHGPLCQITGVKGVDTRQSVVSSAFANSLGGLNNNVKSVEEEEVGRGNVNAGLKISEEIVAEMIEMGENKP